MAKRNDEPLQLPGEWKGWCIDRYGLLWAPDTWRQGFTPWQLRAMFFECQQIPSLKAENRLLTRDLDRSQVDLAKIQQRAAFYRRQCHFEAKIGLSLQTL